MTSIVLAAGIAVVASGPAQPGPCRVIRDSGAKTLYVDTAGGLSAGQRLLVLRIDDASAGAWEITRIAQIDGSFLSVAPPLKASYRTAQRAQAKACVLPDAKRTDAESLLPTFEVAFPDGATAGSGWLTVSARPWAEIWVDGRKVASETPLRRFRLPAGVHYVRLTNPNTSFQVERAVEILPDRETQLFGDLFGGTIEVRGW